eukprot:4317403-Pyramimonas_sp.AAC.1
MIEAELVWPRQTMITLGRLLPKKTEGDRLIGLLSMFSRLWSLIREPVIRQWSDSSAPYWDTAAKGNAALREAF